MEQEKKLGENPEEIQTQELCTEEPEQQTAPAAQEEVPETAAETEPTEKENAIQERIAGVKKGLAAFWKKVSPVVEEIEEEPTEEVPAEDVPAEEVPVQEVPAEEPPVEAPVRRKPADAFNIDFPIEEPTPLQPEQTEADPEQAEQTEEAAEDLFADEEAEVTPAKKSIKPFMLGLILGGGIVLLGLLVFFVLRGAGVNIGPKENDIYYKTSYTATDETVTKKADTVVATIGDKKLTVSELQLYYINGIYTFYSQNYYYLSMMGLDLGAPLDEQYYMGEENMTWEQFFLDAALRSWQSYTIVEILAEREGFTIPDEIQEQIDTMDEQLESIAVAYGYEDVQDYLNEEMAPGVSLDAYVNFNRVYCISNEYVNNFYVENYPNSDEILRYYQENQDVFESSSVTQNMGLISSVRHILIQPKGGETDESGTTTYSEDEWATALSEAERILKQWQEGEATEESFAVLANTYSEDGGSNTTGGLYEEISVDASYVPEFKNWATDASRQPGDTEIVKTTYGYHIMYFVSGEDYFEYLVGEQLVADRIQEKLLQIKEELPMEVSYKKILLCEGAIA